MLSEEDLPDIFQSIVIKASPLCIRASTRRRWRAGAVVAAFLHAGCAFGSLARCCLELLFHLLKVLILLAPAAGLLLSSLTLQALTQGPSAAPPRRATPKGCPCGPQPRPGRCAQDEGKPLAHLGQHAQRHVHQLRLVHAVHGRRPGHRNGTLL